MEGREQDADQWQHCWHLGLGKSLCVPCLTMTLEQDAEFKMCFVCLLNLRLWPLCLQYYFNPEGKRFRSRQEVRVPNRWLLPQVVCHRLIVHEVLLIHMFGPSILRKSKHKCMLKKCACWRSGHEGAWHGRRQQEAVQGGGSAQGKGGARPAAAAAPGRWHPCEQVQPQKPPGPLH